MNVFFLNPWGLLALLGIPAVLLIHLLRRKSRTVTATTRFLVSDVLKSREGGRRIQTLRSTLPLWIQLLTVLLLALLLAGPRWVNPSSQLKVVVVMDGSASMAAFRKDALLALDKVLDSALSVSSNVDLRILDSDASPLFSGSSAHAARDHLEKNWQPSRGAHDFSEALTLARRLAGPQGAVILLTDHPPAAADLGEGVDWVACGQPSDNAAFLSGTVEANQWTAILRDFSREPRGDIRWRLAGTEPWMTAPLNKDGIAEIKGSFAAGSKSVTLELPPDLMLIDNLLPMVIPAPKPLGVSAPTGEFFQRILRLAAPITPDGKDLMLVEYDPLDPSWPSGPAIVFLKDPSKSLNLLDGDPVAENDPLMQGLDWRGLFARDSLQVPFRETDGVLLWQGQRPLIFVRPNDGAPQLIFNFDVSASQATRLPAFALLIHRFLQERRNAKSAYFAANVTAGERLPISGAQTYEAPLTPSHFSHKDKNGELLFEGASQFGDPRESDLRKAATGQSPATVFQELRTTNARGGFLEVYAVLLLAGLLLWNWWLTGVPPSHSAPIAQPAPRKVSS